MGGLNFAAPRAAGGTIAISDATCAEGVACAFTVTQTGGTATASVSWTAAGSGGLPALGGSVCPGVDFAPASGTVAVGPSSSAAITVNACADAFVDPGETFTVTLTGTTSGTIVDSTGVGNIS
jgi:hypothetical protein